MFSDSVWSLVQAHPLVSRRKKADVFAPLVGDRLVAAEIYERGLACLNRGDLSVISELSGEDLTPLEWLGDRLLVSNEDSHIVAWDPVEQKEIWAAPGGDRGCAIWRGQAVLASSPGRLEVRTDASGEARPIPLKRHDLASFTIVGDIVVYETEEREIVGFDMLRTEERWRLSLRDSFQGLEVSSSESIVMMFPTPDAASVLVHWRPAVGLLDPAAGCFRWTCQVATSGHPATAKQRVAFLNAGHLHLLNTSTGEAIVERKFVTPTLYESPPCVGDDGFVVVDQQGYIVTIGFEGGEILGLQKEKDVIFNGCAFVDGRLLVGASDGALWEFRPDVPARSEIAPSDMEKGTRSKGSRPTPEFARKSSLRRGRSVARTKK